MKDDKSDTGEMRARRETMADERRYIIYYTFETIEKSEVKTGDSEERKNV